MTEAQINELKKAKYAAYYNAEDWQGAAKEVKAANVRLPAGVVDFHTFAQWFSAERMTLLSSAYRTQRPDDAAELTRIWEDVRACGAPINCGSPEVRAMLERMKTAGLIVENDRFGTADAQIESACTEQWIPTAEEISKAIAGHPDLASIKASIWRPNGTRLDQPDYIAEKEDERRAEALEELRKQIEEAERRAQEGNS